MKFALVLLLASLGALSAPEATRAEQECQADQFYDNQRAGCRNCSDVGHLFRSRQAWLNGEVATSNSIKRPAGGGLGDGNEEVFSRLIGLEVASDEPPIGDGAQGEQATPDETFIEAADGDGDPEETEDADKALKLATKRTQKLVARFLRAASDELLLAPVEECRQNQNQSACQMWSNLCVITMYSYSDLGASSGSPSSALSSFLGPATGGGGASEKARRSWQECGQLGMESVCNSLRDWWRLERKPSSVDILNIYAADESLSSKSIAGAGLVMRLNQAIQLLAYKYTLGGKFIGVDQFGLDKLERFCLPLYRPDQQQQQLGGRLADAHLRLGKNMRLRCDLWQALANNQAPSLGDTVFVDLYLGYHQNGAFFVKPIPVLIKSLLYNGHQVNRRHGRDPSRWKLVHRFFFHTQLELAQPQETALVYTKSVHLDLKFKRQDRGLLLSSILLTLDYDHVDASSINRTQLPPKSPRGQFSGEVSVSQTLSDMLSYRNDLSLILTILSVMSSIWSLLKCYHIQRCHGLVRLDLESLLRFLLISCDTLANLFALVSLTFAGLLFVGFKFQLTSHQVLAPTQELEASLAFNIQLAFLFKLIGLAHTLYSPLNADIFFVDWEKPKMLTSGEMLHHLSHYARQQPPVSTTSSNKQTTTPQMTPAHQQHHSTGASFWRPYTIVNRWLQMQTFRRQDSSLQLLLFVVAVNVTQVMQLATADPQMESSSAPHYPQVHLVPSQSATFRLFLLSAIYLGLASGQIFVKRYLYEPLIKNTVHEFIDLCSVANVSLFCMLYPKFGYYLHGRNANGSGDCGIAEINALLEREERDLCSKRGLAPNSDQQAFVLILPRIINDHYRKLLARDETHAASSLDQAGNKQSLLRSMLNLSSQQAATSSFSSSRGYMESVAARNKAINQFLMNFLEHIYKDIDYSVRERRKLDSSFLLNIDYYDDEDSRSGVARPTSATSGGALNTQTPATFCKDPSNSFVSLIWLGQEWHLVLFELLMLLVADLWLGQTLTVTATLVWFLHQLMKKLYIVCARRNLVAKALLDEKFLFK